MKWFRWLYSLLLIMDSDILIVGMPKTGTTQFKGKIAKILYGVSTPSEVNVRTKEYGKKLGKWIFYKSLPIVKTHREYLRFITKNHSQIFYLYRDPIENYISYYIYMKSKLGFEEDILEFLRRSNFFDWYIRVENSWIERAHVVLDQFTLKNHEELSSKLSIVLNLKVNDLKELMFEYESDSRRLGNDDVKKFAKDDFDFFGYDNIDKQNTQKKMREEYLIDLTIAYEDALCRYRNKRF